MLLMWLCLSLPVSACSISHQEQPVVAQAPPPLPPPPVVRPVEPHTPGGVRAKMVRWFSAKGYREPQVHALVEYARTESGFNPCISNGSRYRYTFQWGGPRLRRLAEFSGTRGCPSLEKQFAFADQELRDEPNYSCFWDAHTRSGALAALRRGFGHGRC
jgi:hypothetical protein